MHHHLQRNWARNITLSSESFELPRNIQEIQRSIKESSACKAVGTRHSFNTIGDTKGTHFCSEFLSTLRSITPSENSVDIHSGVRYGDICPLINRAGLALSNLASLPNITVVGACATATHGSGDRNSILATSVRSLRIINGHANVVEIRRDENRDIYFGAVVGLGALGVVTSVELDLVPTFTITQNVVHSFHLRHAIDMFDHIMSNAYSVSIFTNWKNPEANQIWFKRRDDDLELRHFEAAMVGGIAATQNLHPVPGSSAEPCTPQLFEPGPWFERLPHFKRTHAASVGEELQSEYFVPREHAKAALKKIEQLKKVISPLLFISEIRTIGADNFWMSPCYGRHSVGIHFTWRKEPEAVLETLPLIERALAQFHARPHWAKLFTMTPEKLQSLYPKLQDFRRLVKRFDPAGKFRNEFLERYVLR